MTLKILSTLVGASALATGFLVFGAANANAFFIVDPNPGGEKFFNDIANKNVNQFFGSVGANNSTKDVRVDTIGNVDTGAGYSNIKPASKNDVLTSLLFTPIDPNLYNGFSFRGQLETSANGSIKLTVQDNQGNPSQEFSFVGLGSSSDFARIGIISNDGQTIKSVLLESVFKEQKQNEFSTYRSTPVPEPITLIGSGIALSFGAFLKRKAKQMQQG